MFKLSRHSRQAGQVGVIILLTMAGMLTIGLSLASRTTQEIFLSGQEADSARVFNAAEVGIEEALSQDLDFTGETYSADIGTVENVDVSYSIDKVNSLETRLFEGVSVALNVEGVTTGQGLQIDWSLEDSCSEDLASLIALIYFDDSGTTRVRYQTMAACDNSDGFELASSINQDGYRRRYTLPLQTNDFLVRIKPIYADTHIRVTGDGVTLPVQHYTIRSEAKNTQGDEARAVEVQRTLSTAPSMFDYALFSGNTIIK